MKEKLPSASQLILGHVDLNTQDHRKSALGGLNELSHHSIPQALQNFSY
jgi:hypothetical protein